jgi:enoyl-CoA hydratase
MTFVLLERPSDDVAIVRFNRPDVLNALNAEMHALVGEYLRQLEFEPKIRCIVLAGGERAFAAGADIQEMRDRDVVCEMNAAPLFGPAACRKPVIAAVNGFALGGGCEYAMQCDIIVANDKAKFGQPEVKLGLVPGAGATQRLPRAVGAHNALYMLLTGLFISAQEAQRLGLVSEVIDGDCEPRALELARLIASMPPLAVRQIKDVVRAGADIPLSVSLELEARGYQLMFGTQDMREGLAAFADKRKPNFTGR